MNKYAVVAANGLGDALISMVLCHNLLLSGISTTLFSTPLCHLKDWFPSHIILPFPKPHTIQDWLNFDHILAADHACVHENHPIKDQIKLTILKENGFDKSQTLVSNLQGFCKDVLQLPNFGKETGLCIPKKLRLSFRAHKKRVAIHPMSLDPKRCWPQEKFIQLSSLLEQEGFEPYFCMHSQEREQWKGKVSCKLLPHFSTLYELSAFFYESGYFIGNNSGLGHLASLLGLPTLSIFARKSYSYLWRPGWSQSYVTTSPSYLIGAALKQKYWKKLLTAKQVLRDFIRIVN